MHVWGGNSDTTARPSDDLAVSPEFEVAATHDAAVSSCNWRGFAAVAVVALLGWPFISTGTIHAVWAEISRLLSLRWKP
jgi:hypothetical protein